jgi:hypothetical protein
MQGCRVRSGGSGDLLRLHQVVVKYGDGSEKEVFGLIGVFLVRRERLSRAEQMN